MSDRVTLLILGVGGNVSQGILKALALSKLDYRAIGACVSPRSLGLYTVDRAYLSPVAADPSFLDWLISTCQREGVHAILSGVEPVLLTLSKNAERIRNETGAICLVSDASLFSITADKLATCQWLQSHQFNYPRYAASENIQAVKELVRECGYPLFAKPRVGKGSTGVKEIANRADLSFALAQSGYVIQETLGSADSEYTVGCFCDETGMVRGTITMHRELFQGTTYRAQVGDFPEVRDEAQNIAAALRPLGPCNIQLRVSEGKPVCFEINLRFSGTTPMRAHFGFNEVEACIRHYVFHESIDNLPTITSGIALRYWNEMYVDPKALAELQQTGQLAAPGEYSVSVEDYGRRK